MSEGLVRCLKFLVLISIIFYAEVVTESSWKSHDGHGCYWRPIKEGNYEVVDENVTSSQKYASLYNFYLINENEVPGWFCVEINGYRFFNGYLHLTINSQEYEYDFNSGPNFKKCAGYETAAPLKVAIQFDCQSLNMPRNPEIEIVKVGVERPLKTTPRPNEEQPTSDVGDIQYVGVVVGAICIALFTLFSCLTIISARRSNQRESRGRTVASVSCQEEDDNRPDVVADNAPPSYDTVMACPDMYPPTPQDTPHGTPDTTPHLSLHRRALLNQQLGSLPSSASVTPQLNRRSFTPTVASDEWVDVPEYPPPPYPGLANGDVAIPIPEDSTDNATEGERPGVDNAAISQPESENSRASSPNQNSSPVGNQENPWVLNNAENSHLRNRDNNPPNRGNTEQYPMRTRAPSNDSTHSNEDSQGGSTSSSNSQVIDTNPEQDRNPKPGVGSEPNVGMRVAVV